eukprot:jgi/Chrzof1/1116/Cz01g40200.t1
MADMPAEKDSDLLGPDQELQAILEAQQRNQQLIQQLQQLYQLQEQTQQQFTQQLQQTQQQVQQLQHQVQQMPRLGAIHNMSVEMHDAVDNTTCDSSGTKQVSGLLTGAYIPRHENLRSLLCSG